MILHNLLIYNECQRFDGGVKKMTRQENDSGGKSGTTPPPEKWFLKTNLEPPEKWKKADTPTGKMEKTRTDHRKNGF